MIQRLHRSFVIRTGWIYRMALNLIPSKIPDFKSLDRVDINYITLCGEHHVNYLHENLISLITTWKVIPNITIYASHGEESYKAIQNKLSWAKDIITILPWQDCLKDVSHQTEQDLISFSRDAVIGRKLLVVVTNGRKRPTMFCDTDIIWFNKPNLEALNGLKIKCTVDFAAAYSANLIEKMPALLQKPYINSGLIYIDDDVMGNPNLLSLLQEAVRKPDHWSEQAILAIAVLDSGKNVWSEDEVYMTLDDEVSYLPTYPGHKSWIARHYVSAVRHIFWRDVFFIRLGLKP
jgi:hypothetical protein